jgi:hypothetical protein
MTNLDARTIYGRIQEIEHSRDHSNDPMNDEEWATHPLAVEYRSLLKQWWDLPSIPENLKMDVSKANRPLLTRKGGMSTVKQRWGQSIKLTPRRKMIIRLSGRPLPDGKRKNRKRSGC